LLGGRLGTRDGKKEGRHRGRVFRGRREGRTICFSFRIECQAMADLPVSDTGAPAGEESGVAA